MQFLISTPLRKPLLEKKFFESLRTLTLDLLYPFSSMRQGGKRKNLNNFTPTFYITVNVELTGQAGAVQKQAARIHWQEPLWVDGPV